MMKPLDAILIALTLLAMVTTHWLVITMALALWCRYAWRFISVYDDAMKELRALARSD